MIPLGGTKYPNTKRSMDLPLRAEPVQKQDNANAELISSPMRKVHKSHKTIILGKSSRGPDPGASNPNNNQSSDFLEDVTNDLCRCDIHSQDM